MRLTSRDLAIVRLVGRLGQASSGQLRQVFFYGHKSSTRCDYRLTLLTKAAYLREVERRPVGGKAGGSGERVFQLGARGWHVVYEQGTKYNPRRALNFHALAVADAYVAIKRLEYEGKLRINYLHLEPDCHETIRGVRLTPDMAVEVVAGGYAYTWWLEVDMGTERHKQIKDKLDRYWRAFQAVEGREAWPQVLFLVPDHERRRDIEYVLNREPAERKEAGLFTVELQARFPQFDV